MSAGTYVNHMEILPITEMRSIIIYVVDSDSITVNIILCCNGGGSNVVQQVL